MSGPNAKNWICFYLIVIFPGIGLYCLYKVNNPGLQNSTYFSRSGLHCIQQIRQPCQNSLDIYHKVTHLNLTEWQAVHPEGLS